jgi:hypothetical protein
MAAEGKVEGEKTSKNFLTLRVPVTDGLCEEWKEKKEQCSVNRNRAAAAWKV